MLCYYYCWWESIFDKFDGVFGDVEDDCDVVFDCSDFFDFNGDDDFKFFDFLESFGEFWELGNIKIENGVGYVFIFVFFGKFLSCLSFEKLKCFILVFLIVRMFKLFFLVLFFLILRLRFLMIFLMLVEVGRFFMWIFFLFLRRRFILMCFLLL